MKRSAAAGTFWAATVLALALRPAPVSAQELEPGAYWPIPVGLNIGTVVNSFNWGDVSFEPAAPIDEANARINTTAFSFTRAFSLAGRSANASVVAPLVAGRVEGTYLGQAQAVDRFGQGDFRFRLAANLYGAKAMTPKAFASFRHQTIWGVSLTMVAPLGQYDSSKLINLGTNRWSFKPEVGFSQALGHWVVEAMAGIWLFTDNDAFLGDSTREQAAIMATQVHLTYKFTRSMWLAGDANFFTGGRTTIDGRRNLDLQRNSRVGATFSTAIGGQQAIRFSVSRGAYTTIGANFTAVAVGYNYAWVR